MPKARTGSGKKAGTAKVPTKSAAKASGKPAPKVAAKPAVKAAKPKPAPSKPAPPKPGPAKPAASKAVAPKPVAGKPVAGKPAKPAPAPAKPTPSAKAPVSKPAPEVAKGTAKPAPESAKPAATPGDRPTRKGITIVQPKPQRRSGEKASAIQMPKFGAPLLKPGAKPRPLIASGPDAARKPLHIDDGTKPRKTPFDKKQLDRFRQILLQKRSDLIGDVSAMESQALQGSSGSLSHTPQHMAEHGTETFEQALSLDLAAADRKLIREIDDALKRIDDGTYGVCELTGKPIKVERLEELPWARHSIEAARELERRATMPQVP